MKILFVLIRFKIKESALQIVLVETYISIVGKEILSWKSL